LKENSPGPREYFPLSRKLHFNKSINIVASASLSGGPAKKEKQKRQKKQKVIGFPVTLVC